MYQYWAEIVKVIDGDTIDLKVDLGFHLFMCIRVRLARINSYEMKSEKEEERKLAESGKAYIESFKTQKIIIQCKKTEKYGRWLAEVYVDLLNLSDELLRLKLAKPYKN